MTADPLKGYRDKQTARIGSPPCGRAAHRPIFVIQKHRASTVHYDFRLEIDGVLKSWAVPKGPSTDPRDKRLAIETGDHALGYADFEGVIPAGQYGSGTVMVWDIGAYDRAAGDSERSLAECWADGHLHVLLHGDKIRGGYALTHFRTEGRTRQWLLIKTDDAEADARRKPVRTENRSALTGRSMADIQRADDDHA
ncbi:DNA polymerase ligase N-terminal domain-containing protein [Salinisphaera sp. T31B1]|uniref:DNA polymerase ligase N-terminal domain-containing protein n=1 Tax=Salinisphaera sp. T31B1 TaxID=727963 RepID=UPI00333F795E